MADIFRSLQKIECHDGRPNGGVYHYGCPCCRKIGNLNKFKKFSRRLARRRLHQLDRQNNDNV